MRGKCWSGLGLLLLAAALCLSLCNIREERQGAKYAETATAALRQSMPQVPEKNYLTTPEMDMPVRRVQGGDYIGILDIPVLGLDLPVMGVCSGQNLKRSPCRYAGSAYMGDLVIAGHNYMGHFGALEKLRPGDEVRFTDTEGNVFAYRVVELEVLPPVAEEITAGQWDLTLFTCTYSGRTRLTVRCGRI